MGRASSAKKVAKVAQSSRKAKVRQSRGKVFPAAVTAVVILGTLLIWYARDSAQAIAAIPPTTSDHWHISYGFYACDKWLAPIRDDNEALDADGQLLDKDFQATGIHTHGDGVLHVHPSGSKGTGKNAKLGTWFKLVDINATNDSFELPEGLGSFKNGDDCGGKPGTWKGLVWENASDTGDPQKFLTDFSNIRFRNDSMAISLVFTNEDADLKPLKPESAANLAELGAVDGGANQPVGTSTTIASTTIAGADSSSTTATASSSSSTP